MRILPFFTAFVWGSTYTTHKNAKIYRYSWVFAYYRRELWERSWISVLRKNRSFHITHIDQSSPKTRTNWQYSWEQPPELLVLSEHWFSSGFSQIIWLTQNLLCWDRIPAEFPHKHTGQNLFSQQTAQKWSKRSPVHFWPASQEPSHRNGYL